MAAAGRAMHLGADHAVAAVDGRFHRALDRLVEARPAGAALEFHLALEEWTIAAGTVECARPLLEQERTAPRRLGAMSTHHPILLGRQPVAPLGVGTGNWIG